MIPLRPVGSHQTDPFTSQDIGMITLFYCPRCEEYTREGAQVNTLIDVFLNPVSGELTIDDEAILTDQRYQIKDIVVSRCPECGGPTEIVHLDECPHNWHIGIRDPTYRKCRLCGEHQRGKVVF